MHLRNYRIKNRFLFIGIGGILLLAIAVIFFRLPLPMPLFDEPFSVVLLDRDEKLLGAAIADDGQWRFPPGETLPEKLIRASTCYEDKRFFSHIGIDPFAISRAMWQNLREQRVVSGASTITMQVIRLARHGQPRTLKEKLIEAVLAFKLEWTFTKPEILSLYFSHAPFGGNVVGMEAASWRYFGRAPDQLSWAESAMLAVLPNSPALIHLGRNRQKLLDKRNSLLDRLHDENVIDQLSCDLAKQEPLPPAPYPIPMLAPHLIARARAELSRKAAHLLSLQSHPAPRDTVDDSLRSPARIHTTLNRAIQVRAAEILQRHQKILAGNGIHNAAALILDVSTSDVVAYIGNIGAFEETAYNNQVDIITAPRSTGSVLKPLLYAALLQVGELLPSQLVADVPTRIGDFAPQNYYRDYQGAVPAYMALARSLNIPAVRMLRSYGVDRFHSMLKSLGITTLSRPARDYGLTLILGGAEASLWDMTGIYASMARCVNNYATDHPNAPVFFPPTYIKRNSDVVAQADNPLDAPAIWLTFQAMLDVVRPDLEGAWQSFSSSRKVAWKTGTSYGHRDGWAIGVTPRYSVGVWVGNADGEGRPGLTGIETAAPILFELFGILEGYEWFDRPETDLVAVEICAKSGYRAGPYCAQTKQELVPRSGLQSKPCPYCKLIHCDATKTWRVQSNCERIADIRNEKWFVLPPALEWFYKQRHSDYAPLPPYRSDCLDAAGGAEAAAMTLISPDQTGKVYIPIELSGQRGRIVFEAAHRNPQTTIYWHLDDQYLGETSDIHQMALAPSPGEHRLTLVDENGEYLERTFTVLAK